MSTMDGNILVRRNANGLLGVEIVNLPECKMPHFWRVYFTVCVSEEIILRLILKGFWGSWSSELL